MRWGWLGAVSVVVGGDIVGLVREGEQFLDPRLVCLRGRLFFIEGVQQVGELRGNASGFRARGEAAGEEFAEQFRQFRLGRCLAGCFLDRRECRGGADFCDVAQDCCGKEAGDLVGQVRRRDLGVNDELGQGVAPARGEGGKLVQGAGEFPERPACGQVYRLNLGGQAGSRSTMTTVLTSSRSPKSSGIGEPA